MNFTFSSQGNQAKEEFDAYVDSFSADLNLLRGLQYECSSKIQYQLMSSLCQQENFQTQLKKEWKIDTVNRKNKLYFQYHRSWKFSQTDQLSDFQKLQTDVAEYFSPLEIDLSDENQIFIWNELVSAFYGAGNEKYTCVTKILSANKLAIELYPNYAKNGIKSTIQTIKQDIENNLKQYQIFHISLSFQSDKKIFEFLTKQQGQELFKKSLKKIEQSFQNCKVRIIIDSFKTGKNEGIGSMFGKVITNQKQHPIKEVQDIVQNYFLDSLEIYQIFCQISDLLSLLTLKDIIYSLFELNVN